MEGKAQAWEEGALELEGALGEEALEKACSRAAQAAEEEADATWAAERLKERPRLAPATLRKLPGRAADSTRMEASRG